LREKGKPLRYDDIIVKSGEEIIISQLFVAQRAQYFNLVDVFDRVIDSLDAMLSTLPSVYSDYSSRRKELEVWYKRKEEEIRSESVKYSDAITRDLVHSSGMREIEDEYRRRLLRIITQVLANHGMLRFLSHDTAIFKPVN